VFQSCVVAVNVSKPAALNVWTRCYIMFWLAVLMMCTGPNAEVIAGRMAKCVGQAPHAIIVATWLRLGKASLSLMPNETVFIYVCPLLSLRLELLCGSK
jgi:hypothetical protein